MKFRSRFYCMIDEKTKIRKTRDNRETATGGDPPYPPAFHWTCCFYVRVVCVTSVPQALLVPGHWGHLTRGPRGSRGLVPHQRAWEKTSDFVCVICSLLGKPPIHHFFTLLTIDSINKFARNTTNNTSISLKIIPGASSGLWLSITMHYTLLRYPDPESLLVRSSASLKAVRLAVVAMLDDIYWPCTDFCNKVS